MDTALDPIGNGVARRSGVIRTNLVQTRTSAILVRFRYQITAKHGTEEKTLLAEDCRLLSFKGSPANAQWLSEVDSEALLKAEPVANITLEQATSFVSTIIDGFDHLLPHLEDVAKNNGNDLLDSHQRVRKAMQIRGISYEIDPKLPPDVLGIYVYLPKN